MAGTCFRHTLFPCSSPSPSLARVSAFLSPFWTTQDEYTPENNLVNMGKASLPSKATCLSTYPAPCSYTSFGRLASVPRRLDQAPASRIQWKALGSPPVRAAASHAAFEAEAEVGLVECFGRGCRPVYEDVSSSSKSHGPLRESTAARSKGTKPGSSRVQISSHLPRVLNEFWMNTGTAEKYYEMALHFEPRNSSLLAEYAQFVWSIFANAGKAEQLFEQALNESPNDSDILASYACFLWQAEV